MKYHTSITEMSRMLKMNLRYIKRQLRKVLDLFKLIIKKINWYTLLMLVVLGASGLTIWLGVLETSLGSTDSSEADQLQLTAIEFRIEETDLTNAGEVTTNTVSEQLNNPVYLQILNDNTPLIKQELSIIKQTESDVSQAESLAKGATAADTASAAYRKYADSSQEDGLMDVTMGSVVAGSVIGWFLTAFSKVWFTKNSKRFGDL